MTRAVLLLGILLALACNGCLVLPATKTTQRAAGTETSAPTLGRVKQLALQPAASRKEIRVRVIATRECQRQVYAITETTRTKRARFGVDDPRGRALGIFVAPVTIPISALITGIIVASADDDTTRDVRPLRVDTDECTVEAPGVPVALQFPSGQSYRGKTDEHGVVVLAIPADEPYQGDVSVRAGEVAAHVHYEQVVPAVTVARDAIEACRDGSATGDVRLAIDRRGVATRVSSPSIGAAFEACVGQRITGTVFPPRLHGRTVVLPAG